VQDDPEIENMNIKQLADRWAKIVEQRSIGFQTKHILAPFGCDFDFMVNLFLFSFSKRRTPTSTTKTWINLSSTSIATQNTT
jgi:hypothetical protein